MYHFKKSTGEKLTPTQMADFWKSWTDKYPIISIEDGMAEDDCSPAAAQRIDSRDDSMHAHRQGVSAQLVVYGAAFYIVRRDTAHHTAQYDTPYVNRLT